MEVKARVCSSVIPDAQEADGRRIPYDVRHFYIPKYFKGRCPKEKKAYIQTKRDMLSTSVKVMAMKESWHEFQKRKLDPNKKRIFVSSKRDSECLAVFRIDLQIWKSNTHRRRSSGCILSFHPTCEL
ncbi:uncharacterized protein LOC101709177 isoform X10 [Heterocephalus glaber]|uniref:Uncharacterized protein LOC101709177 isoform X10 n=1 Tax=Heterocephalus glaber TaxID=10181 RepID=A0AAX6SDR5_HETGA|nr:uncharacterized protein LOC101709177 isoform X10 [Heterocephalus glaber]